MSEKAKKQPDSRSVTFMMFGGIFYFILLMIGLYGLAMFELNNHPPRQYIEQQFHITLPDSTKDLHYYRTNNFDYIVAKFTIDQADQAKTLASGRDENWIPCLTEPRKRDYMPNFTSLDVPDWWQPQSASVYAGLRCRNQYTEWRLLFDYSVVDEVTIYIEQSSRSDR